MLTFYFLDDSKIEWLTFDPLVYDILSDELVIVTAIGKHAYIHQAGLQHIIGIGMIQSQLI